MTFIKVGLSSNVGQIQQRTGDLALLESLKNPHRHIMDKMVNPLFTSFEPHAHYVSI